MSTAKLRKKRGGSAHETKKLDDGVSVTTRPASEVNALHPLWEKVINEEIRDNLCLQIREEVFEILFKICYEKYLEKQVIDFTVHCVHQAFLKVASVYFIKLDPGEKLMKENPSWTPDKEPVPSRMEPWLGYTVPVVVRKPEEPEEPCTPAPSLVTETSPSSTTARKLTDEEPSLLSQQVYARYQPSTEWPPAAVESVLRHSEEPAKPKPPPEAPPKEKPKRSSAGSRKSKEGASPTPVKAETGDVRRAKLPPIKSKSDVKKTKSGEGSPSTMEIPRPPVIPISALPPTRAELKCTVVPDKDAIPSAISVKRQQSSKKKPASVRWSRSTKDMS